MQFLSCRKNSNGQVLVSVVYISKLLKEIYEMLCAIQYHLGKSIQEWTQLNLWKADFQKFEGVWSALGRPYPFKYFKGCLPLILLGPLLNTSSHLYNLKHVENTHGGILLLVKVTKSYTPPWVFFTFFKLYKRRQITQMKNIPTEI